ncbi:MAG TPA: hypothetical protein VNM87_04450, partial [Candidatus Udaeobacter sp.]|nr:hypothetical protein [Candidatus Udaeobacter sp.]
AGFAYVAIQESGMAVFDVTDPSYPTLIGFADTDGRDVDAALGDDWIMTSGGSCQIFPRQCGAHPAVAENGSMNAVGLKVTPSPIVDYADVRYVLPEPGMARIAAYDATGRCRGVLLDGWQAARDGAVQWNGRGFGQRLPNGAYFLRLETPHGSQTQRITVLR